MLKGVSKMTKQKLAKKITYLLGKYGSLKKENKLDENQRKLLLKEINSLTINLDKL